MDFYGDRFCRQLFLLMCIHQMASGLFRLMASLGRDMIVANTFGSFALLTIMALGGFVLSRGNNCELDRTRCICIYNQALKRASTF